MTEEQKKAIDACKDQAAQEIGKRDFEQVIDDLCYESERGSMGFHTERMNDVTDRAMLLYGEQCRKEGFSSGYDQGIDHAKHGSGETSGF